MHSEPLYTSLANAIVFRVIAARISAATLYQSPSTACRKSRIVGYHEQEEIAVVRYKTDEAIGLVGQKLVQSAPTIVALQWPKLNRDSIPTLLETSTD